MALPKKGRLTTEAKIAFAIVLVLVLAFGINSATVTKNHASVGMVPQVTAGDLQQASSGGSSREINPFSIYSSEPAPMGIADYGLGPNGSYEYATNSFIGTIDIDSLSTSNSMGTGKMTVQLNVDFVFNCGGQQYVYWVQDIAAIDTSSGGLSFITEIWNYSESSANMSSSGISGNGSIYQQGSGDSYYSSLANQSLPGGSIFLTSPATITLNVTSAVNSFGEPMVLFSYDDGYGTITYDTVTFTTQGQTSVTGFEVNGFNGSPGRNLYDSELVLCGNGNGTSTTNTQSDIQLKLDYWNGHNYQMVDNAYNFGSDTGETISDVLDTLYYHPTNGGLYADLQAGVGGKLGELYDVSQIGIFNITSPLASAVLYVTSADYPDAAPAQIPFIGGDVVVPIFPGNYALQLVQNGEISYQGTFGISAGYEQDLSFPSNGSEPLPTLLVTTQPTTSPYTTGAANFWDSINSFLRPGTQSINNMIGGALGGIVPDTTMYFLFVEEPIYLLGMAIAVVAVVLVLVVFAMHRKRGRTSDEQTGRSGSRRLLIRMMLTLFVYAFLTWLILTILGTDNLVNSELGYAGVNVDYGTVELFVILMMVAACCISLYSPYRTYRRRQRLVERSERLVSGMAEGGAVAQSSIQPPPTETLTPATDAKVILASTPTPPLTPMATPMQSSPTTPIQNPVQTPTATPNLILKLKDMKRMLDAGLISQQDYDEQKKKILERV